MIPYGKQEIIQEDIDAVVNVLKSDWLTQGPKVPEFEEKLANYCQAKYAVAVNSATSALHIACLALDIKPHDIVWTSPISFVASANCALYCGATIDFIDIDRQTANISLDALAAKLDKAKLENKLPKAIVVVHMGGLSVDMKSVKALTAQYNIAIIEDGSHAIGGKYLNNPIGCCQYSDICVFSFHPVKIITAAEGGIATTNSTELAEKMALFRSHGVTKNPASFSQENTDAWYYEQQCLGFNYRMTELNAALGISQINRLDSYVSKRNEIAQRYITELADFPVTFQIQPAYAYSAYHLMLMQLDDQANINRKQLFEQLRAKNIGVNVHYIPIHLQPYYQKLGFSKSNFPQAEQYYQHCISLPLFPQLTTQELTTIIAEIKMALQHAPK